MTIFKTICVYVLAFVLVAGADVFALPLMFLFRLPVLKHSYAKLALRTVFCGVASLIVVFIVAWIANKMAVKPSILMIGIPLIFAVYNDSKRIKQAKSGDSRAALMLKQSGQEYDQAFHVRQEYAAAIGSFVGLVTGMNCFMREAFGLS